MSVQGIYSEVIYILVSIKLRVGSDMDKGHYVWDVLYYNTGTLWNFSDDTINQYTGYPMNVYDELLIDKKKKLENSLYIWII